LALAALLTVVVGVGGGAGVYFAGEREEEGIERVEELTDVLAANEGPAENYLIVGSDNRDVIDEDSEDAGLFLDGSTGEGGRSDTIMILRRDPETGAALLSIPRDLWLPIAETGDDGKVNWAYIGGPRRLAETITQGLGIPIHHYVEVDFAGFQQLVDEIGGVEICAGEYAVKDDHSGLSLQPGCQVLDGRMALAYARSRNYEEFREGDWRLQDGAPDLNRIERQQHFLRTAAAAVMAEINSNPFRLGDLIRTAGDVVRLDANVDVLEAGEAMFAAAEDGLHTYVPPVEELSVGDQSALQLSDGADEILEYFRGSGPLPVVPETSEPAATTSG
jgi:LCP family protein required for cell wall assembly